MNAERVRAFLGVWMPMALGALIVGTAINFYFNAPLTGGPLSPDLESWRLLCTFGALFVGGVMILSTYGRYKKSRAARGGPPRGDMGSVRPEPSEGVRE